ATWPRRSAASWAAKSNACWQTTQCNSGVCGTEVCVGSSPSGIGSSSGEVERRPEVDRCYLVAFRTGHPDAGALARSGPKLVGGLSACLLGFRVRPQGEGQAMTMLAVHKPHKGLIAWQLARSRHDFVAAAANECLHLLRRWFECPRA